MLNRFFHVYYKKTTDSSTNINVSELVSTESFPVGFNWRYSVPLLNLILATFDRHILLSFYIIVCTVLWASLASFMGIQMINIFWIVPYIVFLGYSVENVLWYTYRKSSYLYGGVFLANSGSDAIRRFYKQIFKSSNPNETNRNN